MQVPEQRVVGKLGFGAKGGKRKALQSRRKGSSNCGESSEESSETRERPP